MFKYFVTGEYGHGGRGWAVVELDVRADTEEAIHELEQRMRSKIKTDLPGIEAMLTGFQLLNPEHEGWA